MSSIEESICEAIDIIVDKKVESATYDKTIQATIIECVDESLKKYKVRYQDSTFYAFALDSDVTYVAGAAVYVLVPGNDMSQDKVIVGSVKKLGENYIAVSEGDSAYQIIGKNILDSKDEYPQPFEMSSYYAKIDGEIVDYVDVLYSSEYPEADNKIFVDTISMYEYLKASSSIICGGVFQTALPDEQQHDCGNYGILFRIDFWSNADQEEVVTRNYVVDIDQMTGQPYNLYFPTRQYGIFNIDADNFKEIKDISIFCYGFPHRYEEPLCIPDIFVSDLELEGATRIDDDDLNNYSLILSTPNGSIFTADHLDSDTLTIEAILRVKGSKVDTDAQSVPFYWGRQDVGVNSQSQYYCHYLSQGWRCLNDYNIIDAVEESDEPVVEWIPHDCTWKVSKAETIASEVQYKCAVVYNGVTITATITIKNLDSQYSITIDSDQDTQFYYDNGNPTLTCLINEQEETGSDYTYSWAVTSNTGTFSSLAMMPDEYADYTAAVAEYTSLIAAIEAGTAFYEQNKERIYELEKEISEWEKTQIVYNNKILFVYIPNITSFATYQCTVYRDGVYLGTASIVLLNSYETEGVYSLIINDGTYAYKYNESGLSPACSAVLNPISIKALTFTIYDNLGQKIDDDVAKYCDIDWIVPTKNSLIKMPTDISPTSIDEDAGTETYSNIMSLPYKIADRYDITATNNDIYLSVDYKGLGLTAKTHLTFVKEGENGTNGTEFMAKIVPNVKDNVVAPQYLIFTEFANGTYEVNVDPVQSGRYLRLEFYHNENQIYSAVVGDGTSTLTTENVPISITWSMLANKYTYSVSDPSCFSIGSATGSITFNGYSSTSPANIVQAEVSYQDVVYYVTFPILTVKLTNNNYRAMLKEGTGFLYATYISDGTTPKYDNVNPFELTVTQDINGYMEDVSTNDTSSYALDYSWGFLGRVYESSWRSQIDLLERYVNADLTGNQYAVKPVDKYDGWCVTNAIECVISHSGSEVARIHIPIHLMLNRYGLASLNGWDGNSIEINEEGGFILAPQIGAGHKNNNNNTFTGIVMGDVKESNSSVTETGLFGYSEGQRSIFLDADTGRAEFGYGNGLIKIYPGGHGEESTISGSGLTINLSQPFIEWDNGNFSVNSNGYLYAKGGGQIAGWNIDDYSLYTGTRNTVSSVNTANVQLSSGTFTRSINGSSKSSLRMAFGSNFAVDSSGTLYAADADIKGTINATTLTCSNGTIGGFTIGSSALYTNNKTSYDSSTSGVYIGNNGIGLGAGTFYVTSGGVLTAKSGTVGGWQIESNYLHSASDSVYLSNSTSNTANAIYGGPDVAYPWYIRNNGAASFSSIELGGEDISSILNRISNAASAAQSAADAASTNYQYIYNIWADIGQWTAGGLYNSTWTNGSITLDSNGLSKSSTIQISVGSSAIYSFGTSELTFYNAKLNMNSHAIDNVTTLNDASVSAIIAGSGASDFRLKDNINYLTNTDIIDNLIPVSFVFKDKKYLDDKLHFGFIAQQVEEVFTGAGLDYHSYGMIGHDKNYLTLRYDEFIPLIVAKLQQQQKEINDLKEIQGVK